MYINIWILKNANSCKTYKEDAQSWKCVVNPESNTDLKFPFA